MKRIVFSAVGLLGAVTIGTFFIPMGDNHHGHDHAHHHSTEIDIYKAVEPFSLIDQNGESRSLDELQGKVWLANFIFTSCAAECPILSKRVADIRENLGDSQNFAFRSFSVDPQTDTSERLKDHETTYGEDPRWKLLTGEVKDLDTLIKRDFLLPAAKNYHERSEIASSGFIHSNKMAIVDQQGTVRFYADGLDEHSTEVLTEVMQKLASQ